VRTVMFRKNTTFPEETAIEKIEAEKQPLEKENRELAKELNYLHGKALKTDFMPDKNVIMDKRAKLYAQLTTNQTKIDSLNEKQAMPKLILLTKQNIHALRLFINNGRVQIPENLDVEIHFSGCNHVLTMPVYELLRHQSTLETNTQLLSTWEINIRNDYTTTRGFLCEECMAEKRKRLEKTGMYQPKKPIGSATVKIEIFK